MLLLNAERQRPTARVPIADGWRSEINAIPLAVIKLEAGPR
jgi:hypothetical protein